MAEVLDGRTYRLQVDTLLITELRVAFNVEKSTDADPNKARVTVYNLSEDTRARLSKLSRVRVKLEAGYESNIAQLFLGDTRKGPSGIRHVKQGPDWVTTLEAGDGESALTTARVSVSFAPGTSVVEVARTMAKSMGVGLGNLEDTLKKGDFRQNLSLFSGGFAAHGLAGEEFTELMNTLGLEASVQDGALQVLKPKQPLPGTALVLSPSTGLLGIPTYNSSEGKEKNGAPTLKLKSLMQPSLRPGVQVKVESRAANGYFKVKAVNHQGDTHGGEWASECACIPV